MNIINFHLKGKMAHFRRYYSNSSALSYSVPPRTTLIGMIAGLLGYERDSYYEKFCMEDCKIAVGLRSSQKKSVHTQNLLMIKGAGDFNAYKPHPSQTPTEIITPVNLREGYIDYEVWFHHANEGIMNKIIQALDIPFGYGSKGVALSLGTAQHLGWLDGVNTCTGKEMKGYKGPIDSIVPVWNIEDLEMKEASLGNKFLLLKEDLPLDFDETRTLRSKENFIINGSDVPLEGSIKKAIKLDDGRIITWMEREMNE